MIRALTWLTAALGVVGCSTDESSVQLASTQQCATTTVGGIDVYSGTGTIDWAMVKASGRDFAFIKATQGNYNKQSTFVANWTNAAAKGVQRSAYHFFDATIDGVTQAHWFLDELAAAGGMTDADLPPMLDIECPTSSSSTASQSNCEYTGDSGWVATATMKQRIFDWLDTVEAATARKAIIYSYPAWFADVQFTDARLTMYPLFIATYGSCASVPAPWQTAIFWQYSSTGTVPGIAGTGNADVDKYFGSGGDLQTWNGSTIERDAGVADAPVNPEQGDAGPGGGGNAGCGCQTGGGGPSGALVLAVVVIGRLRRRNKPVQSGRHGGVPSGRR